MRLAFCALCIKQRLGLSDDEAVRQFQKNAFMPCSLGFSCHSSKALFDPSMNARFRERLSDEELRAINELIVSRGKEMLVEAVAAGLDDNEEAGDPDGDGVEQLSLDSIVKPAGWREGKNWGAVSIDASCNSADIDSPTDWKLLNEPRQST
ncbi:transposase [Synechococcus sp. 1G10]|uniref:transposase n=1 Tax=Synechococcus sp. 1G10 TaxID=2025605 RepID=UPI0021017A2B|nr:transposase [Synechococcus sp. 1G10]